MPENNVNEMENIETEEVSNEAVEVVENEVPEKDNKVVKIALATGVIGLMILGLTVFAKKVVVPKIKERKEKRFHTVKEFDGDEEEIEEEE